MTEKTIKSYRENLQENLGMEDKEFAKLMGFSVEEMYSWDYQEAGVNLSQNSLILVRIWLTISHEKIKGLDPEDKKFCLNSMKVNYQGRRLDFLTFLRKYKVNNVPNYFKILDEAVEAVFQ